MTYLELVEDAWIPTHSGKRFNPFHPEIDSIDIDDIAHALARQCRWGGHLPFHFSVAEHSVIISLVLQEMGHLPIVQMCGLLHDAGEALGLPDMSSPVKAVMQAYDLVEQSIMTAVARKFGLPWPFPQEVRQVDLLMRGVEKEHALNGAMQGLLTHVGLENGVADVKLHLWPFEIAKWQFLHRYAEIEADRAELQKAAAQRMATPMDVVICEGADVVG